MATLVWFCVGVAFLYTLPLGGAFAGSEFDAKYSYFNPPVKPSPAQETTPSNQGGQKVWCVAKPSVDEMYLRRNIDYACGEGNVDCKYIQPGGPCFLPNSPIAHASYAMNFYYQKNGRNWWTCHFNNTGLVVFTDPSFGKCTYIAEWIM